ncbi:MAG: FMN-binding protein [Phycisphaerae bacterium]
MTKFISQSWLVMVMGIVFASLLAEAQISLSSRIKENQVRALNEAIRAVVPGTRTTETIQIEGHDRGVYKCLDDDGQLVGWALDAIGTGFVDKIRLVAGLDPAGEKITGIKVIDNVETPGLGNKIEDPDWAGQYKGLDATRAIKVQKRRPIAGENEIQAITGATWSSRYVTDIVNEIIAKIGPELDKHR